MFCSQFPAFNSLETEESADPKYPYIILQGFDFYYVSHLEKDMATHSSVLAWRIPGTGEPDGLPSMG